MATEYCNLCTQVIAPSESIADLLAQRCVTTPITAIPTGIDLDAFGKGDGAACRRQFEIPDAALVVGHVGRLAAEKNLAYLAKAVAQFLWDKPDAVFLVVGSGDFEDDVREIVSEIAGANQLVMAGSHTGQELVDAYAAMDVFAFSSQSETQGMVLAEAMAARTPVVALDGAGVRDVLNESNGRMLPADAPTEAFVAALEDLTRDREALGRLGESARRSARDFGLGVCANRILALYGRLIEEQSNRGDADYGPWDRMLARLEIEWNLIVEKTSALTAAVVETEATRSQLD